MLVFLKNLCNLRSDIWPYFSLVRDGKSSQEYSVNAGVPQGSVLGPTPFQLNIKVAHMVN